MAYGADPLTANRQLQVPPVGRIARDPSAVALALDHLGDVAGDLADEQTHRDVGESQPQGERDDESEKDHGQRGESRHLSLFIASGLPEPVLL